MPIARDIFKDAENSQIYAPGETIFEEGQEGEVMYVLIEGQVEIAAGEAVIDVLSPGDIFGEMALIDNSPRSGTARALSRCKVAPVDEFNFVHYVQHSPLFALEVMKVMASRLRRQMAK